MPTLADIGAVPLSEMRDELRHAARGLPLIGRGKVVRAYAMVDADDYYPVSQYRWHWRRGGYVGRWEEEGDLRLLHREIMGLPPGRGVLVDHKNREPLDNRRCNLRLVTDKENAQ